MQTRCLQNFVISLFLVLFTSFAASAADVLENVPSDALGFVVVKNLAETNEKSAAVLRSLKLEFPAPLALLKMATGVGEGLEPRGDMLLAIVPGRQPEARPQFCLWLPVADYQQFVTALSGSPGDGITAVTIAGEDLLVARHGSWALVMDPDQRDRMQTLLAAPAALPAKIATWKEWIASNSVTAVVLPGGWHELLGWAATTGSTPATAADARPADHELAESPFGQPGDENERDPGMADGEVDFWSQIRRRIRLQLRDLPLVARWMIEADTISCGIRIDDEGNALAGVRISTQSGWAAFAPHQASSVGEPPVLYESGDYIVHAAARVDGPFAAVAAGAYARQIADELKNEYHVAMAGEVARRFEKAVENAVGGVTAVAVLTRPGEKPDGTYSNAFLAARVADAAEFSDRFTEVMQLWNEMNKSDEDESNLVFAKEVGQIAGRAATVYTLDMVEAFGAAAIPEVRPSMERLFGPGGKLRVVILPVEKQTVLLAVATDEQVASVLDVVARKQVEKWDERTNRWLPRDADWRLMVNPQGHTRWLRRQMEAMLGTVIGAPLVRQFPESPPIGAAGGFTEREMWVDVAVPAETIRAAGQYLHER